MSSLVSSFPVLALVLAAFTSPASAFAAGIECEIEHPCAWLDVDPDVGPQSLGYCTPRMHGTEKELVVERVDRTGAPIHPLRLPVTRFSDEEIRAVFHDVSITLAPWGEAMMGTLDFNTEKLGLFVFCKKI